MLYRKVPPYIYALSPNDAQLRLLEALFLIREYQPSAPRKTPFLGGIASESYFLEILNWLAQYFVHSNDNVTYATALTVQPELIELHIAKNGSSPVGSAERELSSMFLKETNRLYQKQLAEIEEGTFKITPYGEEAMVYLRLLVRVGWPRLAHKVLLLRRAGNSEEDLPGRFDHFVDQWVEYRSSHSLPLENSTGIARRAAEIQKTPAEVLKTHFRSMVSLVIPDDADDEETKFLFVRKVSHQSSLLLFSTFFKDLHSKNSDEWRSMLAPDDLDFLLRVARRMKRMATYWSSAYLFVEKGFDMFRRILSHDNATQSLEGRLRIVWVEDGPPYDVSVEMCHSPRDAGIFMQRGSIVEEEAVRALQAFQPFAEPWAPGDSSKLQIHPEVRLLHHFIKGSVVPAKMVIGTSKHACPVCSSYLLHAADLHNSDDRWHVSAGASHKIPTDWLLPQQPSGMYSLDYQHIIANVVWDHVTRARYLVQSAVGVDIGI